MKIDSNKIPLRMKHLPELKRFIDGDGDKLTCLIIKRLEIMDGAPECSNISFKQIADEFRSRLHDSRDYRNYERTISFRFYWSKNPFVGHNVISHANRSNGLTINYNTRFHSCESNLFLDWLENFYHEVTHLVDLMSPYSFSHDSQKDLGAAPFVIGNLAVELYKKHYLSGAA